MNYSRVLTIYKDNQKESKELCTELEYLIKMKKVFASKESLNAYDEISKSINILREKLNVIWDLQIELNDCLNQYKEHEHKNF